MPKYGDKTAKRLDAYLKGYTIPKGRVRTGLIAPFHDMQRNFNTMNQLQLKESDPFFHCKANYEAASRGLYGTSVAATIGYGKEIKDALKYPITDGLRDLRANARGRHGARTGKTLQETCPTHHTKYK